MTTMHRVGLFSFFCPIVRYSIQHTSYQTPIPPDKSKMKRKCFDARKPRIRQFAQLANYHRIQ